MEGWKEIIRDVPDFPKKGIIFKDITPLLGDPVQFGRVIDALTERYAAKNIAQVVGIEARGFLFCAALAHALNTGCVMVRKPGKLPYKTHKQSYELEYGNDTIEIHQDALNDGDNVVLIDDVLATGGTMAATVELVQKNFKAQIVEVAFLIELDFLKGRDKLKNVPIHSLLHY